MKCLPAFLALLLPLALQADEADSGDAGAQVPKGPLTEIEKRFVGKWKGMRFVYRWEIERKADRTFEIAYSEPDPDDPAVSYENYATGVWWIEDGKYRFEWLKWTGEDGDFSGVVSEPVDHVDADKVVTLTEEDEHPRNVETRVNEFKMKAWKLKAQLEAGEKQEERP